MQKYLDQVQKYIDAETLVKVYLADNGQDLFYLKRINDGIYLFHLDLKTCGANVDLNQGHKVLERNFAHQDLIIYKYFSEYGLLYVALDNANDEFPNLFRIKIDSNANKLEQVTYVKAFFEAQWTKDHRRMYFTNRVQKEQGLFLTEFFQLDLNTGKTQILFDDSEWTYKVGWSGFKLSANEDFIIVGVDYLNKRELTNFIQIKINEFQNAKKELRRRV